jgi:phosphoribosylformimino-5-aminoimidazole carboxamide ribotide isomerase
MILIPAIDLRRGQCVRLYQGQFNRQTTYHKDPLALAEEYASFGLENLHLVDLDGAKSGQQRNQIIIEQIASCGNVRVQLGGGIRTAEQVEFWLESGVSRVVIGTQAMIEIPTVCKWLRHYGPDKLVLALDVNLNSEGTAYVASHGWTKKTSLTLEDCINQYLKAGLKNVLCTDIGRDGTSKGPNRELYATLAQRYPELMIQASGGVRNINDLVQAREAGLHAAICGRALLDGAISRTEVDSFLRAA